MGSPDTPADPLSIRSAARLDRLPLTSWHWKIALITGLGTFFDLYEVFLGGVLGPVLAKEWHLGTTGKALVISSGFIGMFFGAIALGIAADHFGRRRMFIFNLAGYSLLSLAAAASPNLAIFVVLRICAGFMIGAELTLVDTYLSEFVPARARGRIIAWAYTFGFLGVPLAALLGGRFVASHHVLIAGWRWLLIVGGIGAIAAWLLRRQLPESPRWLTVQGRAAEAEATVSSIEETVRRQSGAELPPVVPAPEEPVERLPLGQMFSGEYRRRSTMLSIFQLLQTIGYYGFGTLAPLVLVAKGFPIVTSLGFAALSFLGYPIGSALSIPLVERFERKYLIIGSALGMGVLGIIFGAARQPWLIVTAGFLLTCVSNVFSNGFHIYQAEIFPTRLRSSAIGVTYSLSRAASALMPFIAIAALASLGATAVFVGSAILMVVLALDVAVLGPRSTGRSLETVAVVGAEPAASPAGQPGIAH
jgi:MFS transporter, putative metabolite:H+ symporter